MLPSKSYGPDIFKKLIFFVLFATITPVTLAISFFSLNLLNSSPETEMGDDSFVNVGAYENVRIYSPASIRSSGVSSGIVLQDARPEILKKYLRLNNSPLFEYADFIVEVSDKYELDYRLLVAIAQKESGLCKVIPHNSHNCWGWGIHSKGTLRFDSYNQSIQTVARGIKKEYIDKGYVTVEEIMSKWIPHSPEGVWAKDVEAYMNDLI